MPLGMLRFFRHQPAPPLAEFVDDIWQCADAPPHPRERVLPSGTVELVINLREDAFHIYDPAAPAHVRRYSGAMVSGTYAGAFVIDPRQHASIIGVHFKPGGASAILGLPSDDLAETHLDLEALWGCSAAVRLRERLCGAVTPAERFRLVEAELLHRLLRPQRARHPAVPVAVRWFEQAAPIPSVHEIARRLGLSQRRFIQVFTAQVGLTPKLFSRILRFQRVRQSLEPSATFAAPDWARTAVRCGYFDQSHLIRDFREFSGLNPGDYLRQRSEHVLRNHVPVIASR
jgi:AraC-like DNA-binding protein